jgi:hypothetical protein
MLIPPPIFVKSFLWCVVFLAYMHYLVVDGKHILNWLDERRMDCHTFT